MPSVHPCHPGTFFFFFSSRRRHTRLSGGLEFRRVLFRSPMPGHLSELQPVNEVNTKGQFFRASLGKKPRFQIQLDKRPLSPGTSREASGVPPPKLLHMISLQE